MSNEFNLLETVGRECLIAIQRHYQGRRLYVPKVMLKCHPLSRLIGVEAAKKLSDLYPSCLFTISRSLLVRERNSSIIAERKMGISAADVAHRYGLTARSVRKICQGERLKIGRGQLFGLRARMQRAVLQARIENGFRCESQSHG